MTTSNDQPLTLPHFVRKIRPNLEVLELSLKPALAGFCIS